MLHVSPEAQPRDRQSSAGAFASQAASFTHVIVSLLATWQQTWQSSRDGFA